MDNTKNFYFKLNSTQAEAIRNIFDKKFAHDETAQNKFMQALIMKAAALQLPKEQVSALRNIVVGIDYSIDKTTTSLYKMTARTRISAMAQKTTKKINKAISEEEQNKEEQNDKVSEEEKSKSGIVVNEKDDDEKENNKDTENKSKKIDFELYTDEIVEKALLAPKTEMRTIVRKGIETQLTAQNVDLSVLEINVKKGELREDQNASGNLGEHLTNVIMNIIQEYSKQTQNIEQVVNNPLRTSKEGLPDEKLIVMAKLKEATNEEFENYINMAGMKDFLGEQLYSEVIKSRQQEKNESENANNQESAENTEETEENGFVPNEEQKNLADYYGIDISNISEEDFNQALKEAEQAMVYKPSDSDQQ